MLAAPAAAGTLLEGDTLARTTVTLVSFVLVSAAVYLLNDVADIEADRQHPDKRARPIAAGAVSPAVAIVAALVTLTIAFTLAAATAEPALVVVLGVYLTASVTYSLGLKRVPVTELFIVASGFVLRAIAGAVGADVPLSKWFLIVVSAGAVYVVTSKRYAELRDQAPEARRTVLSVYSRESLRDLRLVAAGVAVTAYLLWSFEQAEQITSLPLFELSTIPFVLALFEYAAAVDRGAGEAPETVFLRGRALQAYALLWAVVYGSGVYLSG